MSPDRLRTRIFLKMNRQCDEEIEQCSRSLAELEEQQNSRADLNAHIAEIRRVLQAARDDAVNGLINRDFVQNISTASL